MHFDGADGGHVLMLLQAEALSCHKKNVNSHNVR